MGAFSGVAAKINAQKAADQAATDNKAAMARQLHSETVGAPKPAAPQPARAPTGPIKEYDMMRQRAAQRADASAQQGREALQRRFAAMGGLNSGSAIKAQQLGSEAAARQKEDAIGGIDMAEQQERSRRDEVLAGRDFQASEAQKQRDFAGEESARARNMQRETFNADMAFKDQVFRFDRDSKLRQLDQADRQFNWQRETADRQFAADRADTEFNKDIAISQIEDDDEREAMRAKREGRAFKSDNSGKYAAAGAFLGPVGAGLGYLGGKYLSGR